MVWLKVLPPRENPLQTFKARGLAWRTFRLCQGVWKEGLNNPAQELEEQYLLTHLRLCIQKSAKPLLRLLH